MKRKKADKANLIFRIHFIRIDPPDPFYNLLPYRAASRFPDTLILSFAKYPLVGLLHSDYRRSWNDIYIAKGQRKLAARAPPGLVRRTVNN